MEILLRRPADARTAAGSRRHRRVRSMFKKATVINQQKLRCCSRPRELVPLPPPPLCAAA
jgi:hypothetical protein